MKKDQEARILGNQAFIMRAITQLLGSIDHIGSGAMRNELRRRAQDNDTYIRDYLK